MKRTASILLLTVLAGFVVFILVSNQWGKRPADSDILPEVDPNNRKRSPVGEDGLDSNDKEYFKLVTPAEEALRPEGVSRGAWAFSIAELRARGKMNGEVDFFGKIVDEDGDPLPGVLEGFGVMQHFLTEDRSLAVAQWLCQTLSDLGFDPLERRQQRIANLWLTGSCNIS